MKYIKVILSLIVLTTISQHLFAQMQPLTSQYFLNRYIYNPALSGSDQELKALFSYRKDFVGNAAAPETQMFTLEAPFKKEKFGLGGYILNHNIGPQRQTGLQLSYAYHIKIQDNFKISMGLGGNLWNTNFDFSQIIVGDDISDPSILTAGKGGTSADATAGINFASQDFYTGFSVMNLLQSKNNFKDGTSLAYMNNARQYNWMTGLKIPLVDSGVVDLEPSILVKYSVGNAPQADLNLRFIYRNMFWVSGSYRARNTMVVSVGFRIKENWELGYAYDSHLSAIRDFGGPSHEIILRYRKSYKPVPIQDTPIIAVIDTLPPVDTLTNVIEDTIAIAEVDTLPISDTTGAALAARIKAKEEKIAAEKAEKDRLYAEKAALDAAKSKEEKDRIAAEQKAAEEARIAEQKRKDEEAAKMAEQKRKDEEAARIAEQKRKDEEAAKIAEQKRKDEEAKRLAAQKPAVEPEVKVIKDTKVETYDDKNPYNYVIAGSFGSIDNAIKFKDQLKAKGYDAQVIEHTERGFYRVTLFKSTDSTVAGNKMLQMRQELNNPNLWVLEAKSYKTNLTTLKETEKQVAETVKSDPVKPKTVNIEGTNVEVLDSDNKYYHIIAGSFGSLQNANILAKQLEAKGVKPKILEDKERNMFRVSIFSTLNGDEAKAKLVEFQSSVDPKVWVLRKQ